MSDLESGGIRWWERWPVARLVPGGTGEAPSPSGGQQPAAPPAGQQPVPMAVTGRYLPALDGVRALAIAGVLAYHLGYGWAAGGYLGVDLFFVLSGFLITSLLVEEWVLHGHIALAKFWARRARRLLPALIGMLVVLVAWVAISQRTSIDAGGTFIDLSTLRGDALATLFYVANWHEIFAHQSYFAQFAAPSPLEHTWSLAIEEQFYLLWPLVLLAVLGWRRHVRRRRAGAVTTGGNDQPFAAGSAAHSARSAGAQVGGDRGGLLQQGPDGAIRPGTETWRRKGLMVTVGGALLSASWMAYLYHEGAGVNRVYLGTDTRAFELLAGATVAMLVAARPEPSRRTSRILHVASLAALAWLMYAWVSAGGPPPWLFEGGLAACAAGAAVLIADVRLASVGPLGAVLSVRPVRWVGKISYGLYLWHWPVFVFMTTESTGLSGIALSVSRLATTFAIATASFYLL